MRTIRLLASSVLFLLFPALAAGQTAPTPVFGETLEVRVVNLEVVVTDRAGLPVSGLEAGDFELRVDGAEVPIGFFTEVRGGTAIAGTGEPGEAPAVPGVPALAPGEPVDTSYLVFIDEVFSIPRDRNRVLDRLRSDLGRLGPEDRMAIVAFDGRKLTMLTSWSSSPTVLDRALREAQARPAFGQQRLSELRTLQTDQRYFRGLPTRQGSLPRSRLEAHELAFAQRLQDRLEGVVFAAVGALQSFAQPPGRKVMLLLSGGWPEDPAEYAAGEPLLLGDPDGGLRRGEEVYAPVLAAANQIGYTLYTVDVPGFSGPDVDAGSSEAPMEGIAAWREHSLRQTLYRLAGETGGKALLSAQRLDALAAVAADTRSYYWLGFTPVWKGDDRDHEVALRVRREGVRVRSRSGFVDFSVNREVSLRLESGLLLGEVPGAEPLTLEVGRPQRVRPGKMRVPFTLTLAPEQLVLLPGGDGVPAATVELRVAALDENGGRSEVPVMPLVIRGEAGKAGAAIRFASEMELRRLEHRLLVAIHDPMTGRLFVAEREIRP